MMTGSVDCSVRLWTIDGIYVGSFGQNNPWLTTDPVSYSELPVDILAYYDMVKRKIEKKKKKNLQFTNTEPEDGKDKAVRKLRFFKSCVEKWKGLNLFHFEQLINRFYFGSTG